MAAPCVALVRVTHKAQPWDGLESKRAVTLGVDSLKVFDPDGRL